MGSLALLVGVASPASALLDNVNVNVDADPCVQAVAIESTNNCGPGDLH